jgi:hypothetical protein
MDVTPPDNGAGDGRVSGAQADALRDGPREAAINIDCRGV